jgi:multiple sugar transport system permease protein
MAGMTQYDPLPAVGLERATRRRPDGRTLAQRQRRFGYFAIAPALLVLFAILAYPIGASLWLSLQRVNLAAGVFAQAFIGTSNYIELAQSDGFQTALLRSAYFSCVEVVAVVGLGLGVALLLNHPMGRPGIFRVMLIIPWAIAPVANAVLWKWIFNANYGILNAALYGLGLIDSYVTWLGTPERALNMLLAVDIWKSAPFIALLLLAGLQKIPAMLYRAARLDGANSWQQFRYVTLPSLRSTLAIAIILQTLWSFRVFDLIYVLTRGGPADGTVLLNYLAYRETFNFLHIGTGAAIANVIFGATFLLAVLYVWLLRPGGRKEAS